MKYLKDEFPEVFADIVRAIDKNIENDIDVDMLSPHSSTRVWFQCEKNHPPYQTAASHRTSEHPSGCPCCAGRVRAGVNDLTVTNPELAAEWDYDKNTANIHTIAASSPKKFHFKCPEGHEYYTSPSNRLNAKIPCPVCSKQSSSFTEQLIVQAARFVFPNSQVIHRDEDAIGMELDVYLPELSLAFEPGAWAFHNDEHKMNIDAEKRKRCKENNIRLITFYDAVHEQQIPRWEREVDWFCFKSKFGYRNYGELADFIEEVFSEYVDLNDVVVPWKELADITATTLPSKFPLENALDIASPKHVRLFSENNAMQAHQVSIHSKKKFLWTCPECRNDFERHMRAVISSKTTLCPHCGYNIQSSE